tara:strand:- start:3918 stop:4145 length:228 start_codon:yes stop_codon:yes gene_type:complete
MKIEKNIPLHKHHRTSKYACIAKKMQDGDSVLFEITTESHSLRQAIYNQKDGHIPVSRKQLDGKIRVWKVKKNHE